MSRQALLIAPDLFSGLYFRGIIDFQGTHGNSPMLSFTPEPDIYTTPKNYSLPDLLAEVGSSYVFDGILMLPTDSEYTLPGSRSIARSGIFLPDPQRDGADWYISHASRLRRYVDDKGQFSRTPGLPVQIFDRKTTLTCTRRDPLAKEPDIEAVLADLRRTVALSTEIALYGISSQVAFVITVSLEKREYPTPKPPDPVAPLPPARTRKRRGPATD